MATGRPLSLSFTVTAQTAQAVQAVQSLQRQVQAAGAQTVGNPFGALSTGASQAMAIITPLRAGLVALAGAALGVGKAVGKGFDINSQLEDAQLGVKGLLAAMAEVRNSDGVVVQGPEAIQVAAGEAKKQLAALRIEGLKTTATYGELVQTYQAALSSGLGAGFDPTQIRDLSVGLTQAAGAMGLAADQMKSEINALFSGDINADSDLSKRLGITREQVAQWKAAGADTFYAELNKRLATFKLLGDEAATTWSGTLSNAADAAEAFMGTMTEGAFANIKRSLGSALAGVFTDGQVSKEFQGLQETGSAVFDAIGQVGADAISGIVDLLKSVSKFLDENRDAVSDIGAVFGIVYNLVKQVFSTVGGLVSSLGLVSTNVGTIAGLFKLVALAAAAVTDGVRAIAAAAAYVGGFIADYIGAPLKAVMANLREFVSKIPGIGSSLASAMDSLIKGIPADGGKMRAYADGIVDSFKAGRSAIAQTNAELSKTAQQRREEQAELDREMRRGVKGAPGGTVAGKKTPDAPSAADAKKAAAAAKKAAEEYAQALRAYSEAEIEAAAKTSAALRDVAQVQLEAALDARLITQREFLAKKADLDRQALADERKGLEARRAMLAEDLAAAATDPAAQQKAKAALVKLAAELDALDARELQIDVRLKTDLAAFQREIDALALDIRLNILDSKGQPYEAALAQLRAETEALLNDPRVKAGGLQGDVLKQSAYKKQQIEFDEQQRQIQARRDAGVAAEEAIAQAVAMGQKGVADGEREVQQARQDTAAAIKANVDALVALAAANPGNQRLVDAARAATAEYGKLNRALNDTATEINGELAGAARGFVEGIVNGESAIRSLGNALADVFGGLAKRFLNQFEKDLFNALQGKDGQGLGGLLSGLFGSGGGGLGGLLSGLGSMLGFAEGGYTGIGDKWKPAGVVHAGEFVMKASAVRKLGLPFLYSLQSSASKPMFGSHAEGGLAAGMQQAGGLGALVKNSFSPTINTSVAPAPVNVYLDPDVFAKAMGQSAEFSRSVRRVLPDTN